jgi:hypothetical protein
MSEFTGTAEQQLEKLARFMASGAEVDWLVIEPILQANGLRLMDLMLLSAGYRGTNAN